MDKHKEKGSAKPHLLMEQESPNPHQFSTRELGARMSCSCSAQACVKDHRDRMWRRICERLEGRIYMLDDQADNQLLDWVHRGALDCKGGKVR